MKKTITKPTNIKELRDELLNVYSELRNGSITPIEAKEVTNTAGKIISSCKVQLDYAKLRHEHPEIAFLHTAD